MQRGVKKVRSNTPEFNSLNLIQDTKGRYYEISDQYYASQLEQRKPSPEKERDLLIAREVLYGGMKRLTKKQRDVMYLVLAGASKKDIAKHLRIRPTSVTTHIRAAKKKLKKQIEVSRKTLKEAIESENAKGEENEQRINDSN